MAKTRNMKISPISRAWILSLAGFIPFCALSILIYVNGDAHPLSSLFLDMFKIWSAIILSFLGGIRWGAAISGASFDSQLTHEEQFANPHILFFSILPSLGALLALLLPSIYCIPVLMVCFCLQGVWDSFSAVRGDLPKWMGSLRIVLTVLVVAAHILVFFALT